MVETSVEMVEKYVRHQILKIVKNHLLIILRDEEIDILGDYLEIHPSSQT